MKGFGRGSRAQGDGLRDELQAPNPKPRILSPEGLAFRVKGFS